MPLGRDVPTEGGWGWVGQPLRVDCPDAEGMLPQPRLRPIRGRACSVGSAIQLALEAGADVAGAKGETGPAETGDFRMQQFRDRCKVGPESGKGDKLVSAD